MGRRSLSVAPDTFVRDGFVGVPANVGMRPSSAHVLGIRFFLSFCLSIASDFHRDLFRRVAVLIIYKNN